MFVAECAVDSIFKPAHFCTQCSFNENTTLFSRIVFRRAEAMLKRCLSGNADGHAIWNNNSAIASIPPPLNAFLLPFYCFPTFRLQILLSWNLKSLTPLYVIIFANCLYSCICPVGRSANTPVFENISRKISLARSRSRWKNTRRLKKMNSIEE